MKPSDREFVNLSTDDQEKLAEYLACKELFRMMREPELRHGYSISALMQAVYRISGHRVEELEGKVLHILHEEEAVNTLVQLLMEFTRQLVSDKMKELSTPSLKVV